MKSRSRSSPNKKLPQIKSALKFPIQCNKLFTPTKWQDTLQTSKSNVLSNKYSKSNVLFNKYSNKIFKYSKSNVLSYKYSIDFSPLPCHNSCQNLEQKRNKSLNMFYKRVKLENIHKNLAAFLFVSSGFIVIKLNQG